MEKALLSWVPRAAKAMGFVVGEEKRERSIMGRVGVERGKWGEGKVDMTTRCNLHFSSFFVRRL